MFRNQMNIAEKYRFFFKNGKFFKKKKNSVFKF